MTLICMDLTPLMQVWDVLPKASRFCALFSFQGTCVYERNLEDRENHARPLGLSKRILFEMSSAIKEIAKALSQERLYNATNNLLTCTLLLAGQGK